VRSSIGIDIAAPAELVFRLARDVERWPDLLPHYVSTRREGDPDADGRLVVRFVARRGIVRALGLGIPVVWRSRTWSESEGRRLRFVHRGGATNGMDVTWRIEDRTGGSAAAAARCRVEIEHDFRPRIPGWAWFIDRAFTRPIAGRTLATFRAIAEAVHAGNPADTSEPGPPTNPST
jgi:ribosome-associated toxin RatA of RatAB toxin-antitoxin module